MIVRSKTDGKRWRVIAVADRERDTPDGPRMGRVFWCRPPRARDDFPLTAIDDVDCEELDDAAL